MKRYALCLPVFMFILLLACKKETPSPAGNNNNNNSNNNNNNNNNNVEQAVFQVHGISDVKLNAQGTGMLGISVEHVSGTQKKVDLSMSELPEGVTAVFTAQSGTPTFGSAIEFTTSGKLGGTFPVKLNATNGSVSKEYTFSLQLEKASDCTGPLLRYSKAIDLCTNEYLNELTIEKDANHFNRVIITITPPFNFSPEQKYSFYADLNCFAKTLIVPKQTTSNGRVISGTGEFDRTGYPDIRIDYTEYKNGGVETTCGIDVQL